MATKLKDIRLTSVDLVRAGANQEADICLFKSADPIEATEIPTEPEKNIFKRFIAWLKENPTEAAPEPQDYIDKSSTDEIYKSAIIESLTSIANDPNLDNDEKLEMVEKSLEQFYKKRRALWDIEGFEEDEGDDWIDEEEEKDLEKEIGDEMATEIEEIDEIDLNKEKSVHIDTIEEVEKYNHNHGADGKFSESPGAGGGSSSGSGSTSSGGKGSAKLESAKRDYESAIHRGDVIAAMNAAKAMKEAGMSDAEVDAFGDEIVNRPLRGNKRPLTENEMEAIGEAYGQR